MQLKLPVPAERSRHVLQLVCTLWQQEVNVHCVRNVGKILSQRVGGSGAGKFNWHSKRKPFSHRRQDVKKEGSVAREKKRKKRSVGDRLKFRKNVCEGVVSEIRFPSLSGSWLVRVLRFFVIFVGVVGRLEGGLSTTFSKRDRCGASLFFGWVR